MRVVQYSIADFSGVCLRRLGRSKVIKSGEDLTTCDPTAPNATDVWRASKRICRRCTSARCPLRWTVAAVRTSVCLMFVVGSNFGAFIFSYFQAICEFIYHRALDTGPEPMQA